MYYYYYYRSSTGNKGVIHKTLYLYSSYTFILSMWFGLFKKKTESEKKEKDDYDNVQKQIDKMRKDNLKKIKSDIALLQQQKLALNAQKEIEELREEMGLYDDEEEEEEKIPENTPDALINSILLKAFAGNNTPVSNTCPQIDTVQTTLTGDAAPTNTDLLNSIPQEKFAKLIAKLDKFI
jgi:hypothetical protein